MCYLGIILLYTLRNAAMFSGISGMGRVPGGVYTDLRSNGVLDEDPFRRYNDLKYRWVSEDDWTYVTTFKGEGGWRIR